jgi:PAS domain-containing protein
VEAAYRDLIGRAPTAAEVSAAAGRVGDHAARDAFAASLVSGREFRALVAAVDFATYLGRAPTPAETDFVVRWLDQGVTLEQVAAAIFASEEFYARAGRTPEGYVSALFRLALGREPDPAGHAAWVDLLRRGTSRADAALGFVYSAEARRNLVNAAFSRFLGRTPTDAERRAWLDVLAQGARSEIMLAAFVGSDEYWGRVTAT